MIIVTKVLAIIGLIHLLIDIYFAIKVAKRIREVEDAYHSEQT